VYALLVAFQVGGEQSLEFYASKNHCGAFALGGHSKKRPHNLVRSGEGSGSSLALLWLVVSQVGVAE
jgi:hypothetical protein